MNNQTQNKKIGKAAKQVIAAMLAKKGTTDNAILLEYLSAKRHYVQALQREITNTTFEQVRQELGLVRIAGSSISRGAIGVDAYIQPEEVKLY